MIVKLIKLKEYNRRDGIMGSKRKTVINGILITLIIVLCIIIAKVLFFTEDEKNAEKREEQLKKEMTTEAHKELTKGTETLAIFGVDSRSNQLGKGTRSDSIMVVNMNHETKEIKIASVFRDCYVDIKGHGLDKITHAHSFGGPELAMDTLNRNFDLDIDKYITVNFGNVAEVIDDLGGIQLEITDSELKYINGYIDEINKVDKTDSAHITKTGTQKVDGTQAVAYSRIRYTAGGDYKRAERQRTVLMKVFENAKQKSAMDLIQIVNKMMDKISTNYSSGEVMDILAYLAKYDMEETKGFPTKLWGGKIDGVWYGVPVTLESNVKEMHSYLFDEKDYKPSSTVKKISDQIRQAASTPNEELE